MSQGSLNPKIRFLRLKVCPVARSQTDTEWLLMRAVFQSFRIFSFSLSSRIGPISPAHKNHHDVCITKYLLLIGWWERPVSRDVWLTGFKLHLRRRRPHYVIQMNGQRSTVEKTITSDHRIPTTVQWKHVTRIYLSLFPSDLFCFDRNWSECVKCLPVCRSV